MNCQNTKEQISQLLDNELSAGELQSMFRHLSECEECRTFFLRAKEIHDSIQSLEYSTAPNEIDQKFAVLGMEEQSHSIFSRKFTISVPSALYSVGAAIIMSLFIYVVGNIQEKSLLSQYQQTMSFTGQLRAGSSNNN